MPKLINGRTRPQPITDAVLVAVGGGKSAYFFSGAGVCENAFILTEHQTSSDKVQSLWSDDVLFPISQGSLEDLRKYLQKFPPNKPLIFLASTYPERFLEWLEKIFANKELSQFFAQNRGNILFFLPHLPNDAMQFLRARKLPIIAADYYIGIGNAIHDEASKTSQIKAGVKEETLMAFENCDEFFKQQGEEKFRNILANLSLNQTCRIFDSLEQIDLLPTNAILHLTGIVAFVAQAIGVQSEDCKTAAEFFEKVKEEASEKNLINLVGQGLKGKGFYREMPKVAPDILMKEISSLVCKIRISLVAKQILPKSDLDLNGENGLPFAHIFNHLRSKYQESFYRATAKNVWGVSFSEFINTNPPYQNPAIIFPTDKDGSVDVKHRFFCEELPTFKLLQDLAQALNFSKQETRALDLCIEFIEKLTKDKQIVPSQNVISPDSKPFQEKLRSKL